MSLVNMQISNNLRIGTSVIMSPPNLEHSINNNSTHSYCRLRSCIAPGQTKLKIKMLKMFILSNQNQIVIWPLEMSGT